MNIAVLTSGGVDSSLALYELKKQGHNVTAFYLKIWLEDELSYLGTCPWEEDLLYVRRLCEQLDVSLVVVNLQEAYWSRVVRYALDEIKAGRTPNPDIMCNKMIKFGAFQEWLDKQQGSRFDYIATGHYAWTENIGGRTVLTMTPDPIKDQTYFLSQLSQDQLSKALFPIGRWTKAEVRERAKAANLPTFSRKDSQGICFLGTISFADFLHHHFGDRPGDLIEVETGKKVGTHRGFYYYTLGQRQGLGLSGGPWYVVRKDATKNIVYISRTYYAVDKVRNSFSVGNCNWMAGVVSPQKMNVTVKLRHGPHLHQATLAPAKGGAYHVQLATNDQGIAPGQYAVFYDGNLCLGSGVILEPTEN